MNELFKYIYVVELPYKEGWYYKWIYHDYYNAEEKLKEIVSKDLGIPYESIYDTGCGVYTTRDEQYQRQYYKKTLSNMSDEEIEEYALEDVDIDNMNSEEFHNLIMWFGENSFDFPEVAYIDDYMING